MTRFLPGPQITITAQQRPAQPAFQPDSHPELGGELVLAYELVPFPVPADQNIILFLVLL